MITRKDLLEQIVEAMQKQGCGEGEIAGYLAAQESNGCLRKGLPQWQRNAAAVHFYLPGDIAKKVNDWRAYVASRVPSKRA